MARRVDRLPLATSIATLLGGGISRHGASCGCRYCAAPPAVVPHVEPQLTSDQLLALQSLAISEGNVALKIQTWIAQGRDPRYGYCEVLEGEQRTAMAGCVDAYEMARLVGCAL